MCLTPVMIPNVGPVACRECRLCRDNRVNDWVGRCIAESKTATHAYTVTLTYGGDDKYGNVSPEATVLTYSDVQGYLKRLRKWTPGTIRFFVTGEFGSAKGRAHWHMCLFVYGGDIPNLRLEERYLHDDGKGHALWKDGFSFWKTAHPENLRYACKYILKAQTEGLALKAMGLSTKPPLGDAYFRLEAARYVDQGLAPRDLFYRFPEDRLQNGQTRTYKLSGAPAYNYLAAFDAEWQGRFGNELWPQSELMDAYCDLRDRLARRATGLPDWPEEVFMERSEMERLERKGQWW